MSKKAELYGWKGFGQLAALFALQALLGIVFDVELLQFDPALWSPLMLLTVAVAVALVFWQWHLLVPTLVRFELVFMPTLERRLLAPLVAVLFSALAVAILSREFAELALEIVGGAVLLVSLVSLASAWFLLRLLRGEMTNLRQMQRHFASFALGKNGADVRRLELYLRQRAACSTPGIPIRGIEFPGLTSRPWHERADFPWLPRLESAYPMIRDEILAALGQATTELAQYRYLGVSTAAWQSLMLFREPEGFVPDNCAKLPKTIALLRSLPITVGREVMVSVLKPHARIPAHRDSGNLTLTCQLGIVVPPSGCAIRVGREERTWPTGECIIFDTTYEHEVWNDSDEARIVFLFDFLHPDLTPTERAFFAEWGELSRAAPEVVATPAWPEGSSG